jgi:tetratricopeptide (TPR) repeat protein
VPRLSLCMIVRDEAGMLPGFLAACAGLWDDLCVVDTGSQDATVALLTVAGARLVHRPWDDDFAAARNASLGLATGDWILFLDADERPTPAACAEIRALLADDTAGAATIVMRNALPHGRVREAPLLRLFRRDPAIRFRHRIHEEVATTVSEHLRRTGRRLVALNGRVDHLGYVREVAAARAKLDRDRDLLTACVAADPHDWYSWYKLLELARFWDDRALWHETARLAAPFLPHAELRGHAWGGELLALCAQGAADDPADQLSLLDAWSPLADASADLHLRRGALLERLGDFCGAASEFKRCLALPPGADASLTTVRPHLGLCRIAAAQGDLGTARDHVRSALVHGPRDPEALLAALSFAWLEGGRDARDSVAAEHRAAHGATEELDAAIGDHALRCGLWDDANAAYATLPGARAALRRAQALLGGGDASAALAVCRSLVDELPEAALGMLTSALVLGEEVDLTVDLAQEQADAALREWVALLWRSRRAPLLASFLDHAPAVFEAFPWLRQELGCARENVHLGTGDVRPA